MQPVFDHEKLRAYQEAVRFSGWVETLIEKLPAKLSARDQLDRASTSIALNIAEVNGKRSHLDRCRYLDIARGSAVECAAGLDVLIVQRKIETAQAVEGKAILLAIVSLISGLIARFSTGEMRLGEDQADYEIFKPVENE